MRAAIEFEDRVSFSPTIQNLMLRVAQTRKMNPFKLLMLAPCMYNEGQWHPYTPPRRTHRLQR